MTCKLIMILCGDINAFYNNEVLQLSEEFPKFLENIIFFICYVGKINSTQQVSKCQKSVVLISSVSFNINSKC